MPMVRLPPMNGLSTASTGVLHLCGSARFPLGTSFVVHPTLKELIYLQNATRSNKVKQKVEAKEEETKNKNIKSDNEK